jgi:undecaprenyl-diphosphatase
VDRSTDAAASLRPLPLLIAGLVLLALACALGAWIYARGNVPFAVDQWWNGLMSSAWSPILTVFSRVMDFLGGGWFGILVVPIAGAIALVIVRRPWSAVYLLAAQVASAGIVQLLKHTFGRARPEDMIILSDYGSYPSGHVANATTIAVAAMLIFPRIATVLIGAAWVIAMAFSRTYLHVHWLSDTLGGALAGAGAALLVAAAFTRPMNRERRPAAGEAGAVAP